MTKIGENIARSARALGRDMTFLGSKEQDLVLQTKGRVKINFGDKFTELFNGSKFCTDNDSILNSGTPDDSSSDGFYFDGDTLYLKFDGSVYEIFSNAASLEGYVAYTFEQSLTGTEKDQAKNNIGSNFATAADAIASGTQGVVFITGENKAYLLYNSQLYPITNNTTIEIDDKYYFDQAITIDVSADGSVLTIEGLNKYITIGLGNNVTNIYQTEDGAVIDASKSIVINVDDTEVLTINDGGLLINNILKVYGKVITDEIYSSNFSKNVRGWGIWIDSSGESYLQVDNLIVNNTFTAEYITYQEALTLIASNSVKYGQNYVLIDYQNEWEITSNDDTIGTVYPSAGFDYPVDSEDPSQYEDKDTYDPIFGLDRNVRPLILVGKSESSFEDEVYYFYSDDSENIIKMLYDIRFDQNYDADSLYDDNGYELEVEYSNKGRIYYMQDSWHNEGSCDFKHYTDDNGLWMFNSSDNENLTTLNTVDNIVCSNNKLLDPSIRYSDTISVASITGTRINNNTFVGTFTNNTLGSAESVIENNIFYGNITDCVFTGEVTNNTLRGSLSNCQFTLFNNNSIIGDITNWVGELTSNDITVTSAENITSYLNFERNVIKVEELNNVVFNGDFINNNLSYYNIVDADFASMTNCSGSGESLTGAFSATFMNCSFKDIVDCAFRADTINYAKFRSAFTEVDFNTDSNITDLELLYDSNHQVDVFNHNEVITVSCQACSSAIKGEIRMFSGLESDIPSGWQICDGTNGTPNLIDKFIKGSRVAGQEGGNSSFTLTSDNIPAHTHEASLRFSTSGWGMNYYVASSNNTIIDFIVDAGGSTNYCLYTGRNGGENYSVQSITNILIDAFNSTTLTIGNSSGSTEPVTIDIEPTYYTLIFIMKL